MTTELSVCKKYKAASLTGEAFLTQLNRQDKCDREEIERIESQWSLTGEITADDRLKLQTLKANLLDRDRLDKMELPDAPRERAKYEWLLGLAEESFTDRKSFIAARVAELQQI